MTDEELTALALAADPNAPLDPDAVPIWEHDDPTAALPDWYMPTARATAPAGPGWRRRVAVLVIGSFLAIDAAGLCSTYGHIVIA